MARYPSATRGWAITTSAKAAPESMRKGICERSFSTSESSLGRVASAADVSGETLRKQPSFLTPRHSVSWMSYVHCCPLCAQHLQSPALDAKTGNDGCIKPTPHRPRQTWQLACTPPEDIGTLFSPGSTVQSGTTAESRDLRAT